jgi:hypothetical protein
LLRIYSKDLVTTMTERRYLVFLSSENWVEMWKVTEIEQFNEVAICVLAHPMLTAAYRREHIGDCMDSLARKLPFSLTAVKKFKNNSRKWS